MKKGIFTFTLLIFISLPILAQTPEHLADIRTLLELTGGFSVGEELREAITPQILALLEKTNKKPSEKTVATVKAELKTLTQNAVYAKGGLVEKLCHIYSRYYNADDIKKLISFYQSDIGKKTTKVMPLLMKESMAFSQGWLNNIAPTVVSQLRTKLKKKGIILPEI